MMDIVTVFFPCPIIFDFYLGSGSSGGWGSDFGSYGPMRSSGGGGYSSRGSGPYGGNANLTGVCTGYVY